MSAKSIQSIRDIAAASVGLGITGRPQPLAALWGHRQFATSSQAMVAPWSTLAFAAVKLHIIDALL